jgi:DNA polymerase elongation subunit (family B)
VDCVDIATCREYDVPYHVRVSIDLKITVSRWYSVYVQGSSVPPEIKLREDLLDLPVSCFHACNEI